MTQQPWTPHLLGNVAATDWYLLDGNSKLHVHWENHDESLMNTVKDEKANSLIPRAVRDFVLPAGFLVSCRFLHKRSLLQSWRLTLCLSLHAIGIPNKLDRMDQSHVGYIKSSKGIP
ncbi:unnamed protein product [Triticum turgidum subsp. durum]|uniref:Uncharacterized protein n=1 Tax=Triticum turgidum subsp. durum TaxID=4567 RepID=A0A9R1A9G1_TRITD|nr:unnamed protein product [Triticum turgidum subsp. durum]